MRTASDTLVDRTDSDEVLARIRAVMDHRRRPDGCSCDGTTLAMHYQPFDAKEEVEALGYALGVVVGGTFDAVRDREDRKVR